MDFRYTNVPNTAAASVQDISCAKILFRGTLKECRAYKRKHYNAFSRIYLSV